MVHRSETNRSCGDELDFASAAMPDRKAAGSFVELFRKLLKDAPALNVRFVARGLVVPVILNATNKTHKEE